MDIDTDVLEPNGSLSIAYRTDDPELDQPRQTMKGWTFHEIWRRSLGSDHTVLPMIARAGER
jgi:hypothetical protein